jgi:transcriptional regulator GlxA family with amidase domain
MHVKDMRKTDINLRQSDESGSNAAPFRVGIWPVPGFALMSYACTVEPLRAANLLSRKPLYDIVHFASGDQAQSSGAASVEQVRGFDETPDLDMLLVVAGGDPFQFEDSEAMDWLRAMAARCPSIGGVSGGAVLLARAGLMEGRRMTVHWEHGPELSERFPDALIERRLYVMDRDRVSCGGGTAPLDMMHAVLAAHHGAVFARLVSDWFLHTDIRAAAAPQRAGPVDQHGAMSAHLSEAVEVMENHIADPLTLSQIAMVAGVSPRHLNRLCVETFNRTAMAYYRGLRLDVARRLVTASTMSFGQISEATGFSAQAHFSNAYLAHFNVRPMADRQNHAARAA